MNKLRRIVFALFITLSLILGLSACRNKVKVEFDQASYTIKEGFEQKVPMHLTGVKFDNKDLVVESSNPNVFTVVLIDGFAEVTAVAPGTATLKILYKQKELASVEIKVIAREDLRVESLSIDLDTELNIEVGISEDVPITLTNIVYNDPDLTIISSNQLVATAVIKEGFITVTGVAVGTATLTLKKGEAVDTLVVNVSEGEVVIPDDETLVTFIVEVPMDTIGEVYVVTNLNDFDVEDGILLTKNADGKYEGSKSMKIGHELKYKYVNGKSWDYVEKLADGSEMEDNRTVTITDGMAPITDTVALWAGDIPPVQNVNVTFSVEVPADTKHVYIAGSFNNWNETDPIEMAKDIETGKFTVVIELEVGQEVKYKYLNGKDWEHVEKGADGEEIGNRLLTPDAETTTVNDVVATWNLPDVVLGDPVTFKIIVTVPETTGDNEVHLISNLDEWSATKAHLLTKNEVTGKYEIELTHPENTVFKFKFVLNASWDRVEVDANGNDITDRQLTVVADMQPTECEVLRWKEIVDPTTKVTVRIEVAVPAETPADADVYLISDLDEWKEANAHKLTPLENGNFEIELSLVENSVFKFKFVLNGLWANVEQDANGEDIDDRSFTVTADLVLEPFAVARWKGIDPIAEPTKVTVKIEVAVPAETPADAVIYIIGELPGLENVYPEPPTQPTHAWGNFTDDYKLVRGEDGKYRISIESEPNFYLRYNYYIVMGDKNIREIGALRTHTAVATNTLNDEVTKWEEPVTITFSVTVPEGTPASASVYVIGVFKELIYPGMGVNPTQLNHQWNNFTNKYKMTKGEGSVYTLSLVIDYNYTFFYKYVYTVDNIDRFWETGDDRSRTATETITLNDTVSAWEPAPAKYTVTFSVTVPAVPEGANVYMIGVFPGLLWLGDLGEGEDPTVNHQWNNFSNTYKMTKGEGNVYTLNVEAPVNFTLIYKYAILTSSNDRVWEVHDNREYVVTAAGTQNDVVNSWEEIPTTDKMVLISVAAPAGTENVYFVGNVTEPTWDVSNPVPLTYNSVSGKFEIEAPFSVGYVLEYIFVCGPHWAFVEVDGLGGDISNRQTTIQEETTSIEVTVAGWKNVYDPDGANVVIEFIVTVPAGTTGDVYLVGINGWDLADGIKLTKNNETGKYEGNVTLQSGHVYEYKFVNGTTWETGANRVLVPTSDQTEQADTVTAWSS